MLIMRVARVGLPSVLVGVLAGCHQESPVQSHTPSPLDSQSPAPIKQPPSTPSQEVKDAIAQLRNADLTFVWVETGETDAAFRGRTVQAILATYGIQDKDIDKDITVCDEPPGVVRSVIVQINTTERRELWLKYDKSLELGLRPWPREVILAATVDHITGSIYSRREVEP